MDGPRDYHIKWSKSDRKKKKVIWYHLNVEPKKKIIQMNLYTKQKQTHRIENKLMVTHPYIKTWINRAKLLQIGRILSEPLDKKETI